MCTTRIALSSRPPAVRLTGSTGTSTTKCSADRSGVTDELLAASTHGYRQTKVRIEPVARQDSQTNHRATVGGRGGAILVQLSELPGLGHRGIDAPTGSPVARSLGSESRRSSALGSADSRAW